MRRFLSGLLFIAVAARAAAATSAEPKPIAELKVSDAIILGVVEGVTEYLPVSSTGHLIVACHFLHLDADQKLNGPDGQPLWYKKPSAKHPEGEPLTVKLAADSYTVVIQFGAIAAVALLYWRQILSMINGLLGRDPAGLRLLICLLVAFLPAAVIGFAIHDFIDNHLFSVGVVIAAQAVGAFLILWAEGYRKRLAAQPKPVVETVSPRQALNIGLLQCVALWPGMSRSMMTIIGGYFVGLDPKRAAEFSFLLGFVTLTAATVYKSYQSGTAMIQVFGLSHVLLGCVVATVAAALAVRFLVGWLSKHGMAAFAYYRLAFALVLAAVTWM